MTRAELKEHGINIPPQRAKKFLSSLQRRRRRDGGVSLFHDGRWKELCRQDLLREVKSSFVLDDLRDIKREYVPLYGIRITAKQIVVIDAATDG